MRAHIPPEKVREFEQSFARVKDSTAVGILGAVVVAAGGRVELTEGAIVDFLERNMRLQIEPHGRGFVVYAAARPRCPTCNRFEREE